MKFIFNYLKERFPVLPLFLFTIITISGIAKKVQYSDDNVNLLFLALVYLGFLFHLRVLDEFKDFDYDKVHHSQRPVQRGSISLTTIKVLGVINLLAITILSLIVNPSNQFIFFAFAMLYTLLMFREFFIQHFYEKSPTLYLLSHQIVFIPLYIFFFLSLDNTFHLLGGLGNSSLFIYSIVPIVLVEIGRKMNYRFDFKGNKTNDTYVYVWGEKHTIFIFFSLVMLCGFIGKFIDNFLPIYSNILIISSLLLLITGVLKPKNVMKNHMLITILYSLGIPFILLL